MEKRTKLFVFFLGVLAIVGITLGLVFGLPKNSKAIDLEFVNVKSSSSDQEGDASPTNTVAVREGFSSDQDFITVRFPSSEDGVPGTVTTFTNQGGASSNGFWYGVSEEEGLEMNMIYHDASPEDVMIGSIAGGDVPISFGGSTTNEVRFSFLEPVVAQEFNSLQSQAQRDVELRPSDEEIGEILAAPIPGRTVIDIMIVWTKDAECRLFNKNRNFNLDECVFNAASANVMRAYVTLAVEQTNVAFRLSGADVELNLVHAYGENYYSLTSNHSQDLVRLEGNGDGYLDEIHALRDIYGADLVTLVTSFQDRVAGVGRIRGWASVMNYFWMNDPFFIFPHEIGHNLGLNHHRGDQRKCGQDLDKFNYAYKDPNGKYRSIMAYDCNANSNCGNPTGSTCLPVQRFSSSTNTINNANANGPLGDATMDNTRQIIEFAPTVAAFKERRATPAPMVVSDVVTVIETPNPTPLPTPLPTPFPTPLPTPNPTPLPTPNPTPGPTPLAPTPGPMLQPEPVRSPILGSAPTPRPTPEQTRRPMDTVSSNGSVRPSIQPVPVTPPTGNPSIMDSGNNVADRSSPQESTITDRPAGRLATREELALESKAAINGCPSLAVFLMSNIIILLLH